MNIFQAVLQYGWGQPATRQKVIYTPGLIMMGLLLVFLASACTAQPESTATPPLASSLLPTPTAKAQDPYLQSSGGGEPRSPGYWLIWNTCAENNQAETARANGGREAGWIVMEDLLAEPGILVGTIAVESCLQGVNLLQAQDLQGVRRSNDPAYALAAQLMAAQLNLATGSEYCPASDQAVSAAQLLLLGLNFNGQGSYLGPPVGSPDIETAQMLMEQLASYNTGALCR